MKTVTCEDGNFVFIDDNRRKVLLDISHFMLNRSRYPMQYLSDEGDDIPGLILQLKERHLEINADGADEVFPYFLLDIIVTSHLIRTSVPLKVLEIGAVNGTLSYHLATLMGKLNPESLLCCVSSEIGNSSGNHWLDRVSMVEEPPNLSLLVSDYEATQLETNHFDIVVLNGAVPIDKPCETIREAQRLVKKNGVLLCHVKDAPFLESCFKLVFPERQEYEISPQEMILAAENPEVSWGQEEMPVLEDEVSGLLHELRQTVKPGCRPVEIRPLIRRIDECADVAVKCLDIDRKVELLQLKEIVLDYMLNIGSEFEEYYRNELRNTIRMS